ncbi:MAG: plasmid stabilization protein [Oceanicaulis sp.]
MGAVTIRNLPDEVRRALKVRAAKNNRSAEAEMRAILEAAVKPAERVRIGSALSALSREAGLTNSDIESLAPARDPGPAEPLALK